MLPGVYFEPTIALFNYNQPQYNVRDFVFELHIIPNKVGKTPYIFAHFLASNFMLQNYVQHRLFWFLT